MSYEFFYKYDDKVNYKAGLPIFIGDPKSQTANNITDVDWIDHYGNLDLICNPCESTYKYNLDNYPVEIKANSGYDMILTYE